MKTFALISFLLFYKSLAQPLNGSDWQKYSEVEKSYLCIGMKEGADVMAFLSSYYSMNKNGVNSRETKRTKEYVRNVYNKYISGTSALPFIQGIEKYYSDYRNIKIPLSKVFIIVALEISGESEVTVQSIVAKFRELASSE